MIPVTDILLSRTPSPELFAVSPFQVPCCAFPSSAVDVQYPYWVLSVRSMFEDNPKIHYVRGDIEEEKGCVGKGRASTTLPDTNDELDMTPTKLPPSG